MRAVRPASVGRLTGFGLSLLLCLSAGACAPPLYDATTDTMLTNLQKEFDSRIVQLIADAETPNDPAATKDGSYAQTAAWYGKLDTDMESVELRMEAVMDPSTANLPQIFALIRKTLTELQADHKAKQNLNVFVWTSIRSYVNVQFATLITYELSLKNGGSPSTQSTATATVAKATAPSQ
jgi:hypothetical protein